MRRAYQTDLSDAEWACLEDHLPAPNATGRPPLHGTREILKRHLLLRSKERLRLGSLLPHDFPPWKTVHHHYYFRVWRIDDTWERLNAALRERLRACPHMGRNAQLSGGT